MVKGADRVPALVALGGDVHGVRPRAGHKPGAEDRPQRAVAAGCAQQAADLVREGAEAIRVVVASLAEAVAQPPRLGGERVAEARRELAVDAQGEVAIARERRQLGGGQRLGLGGRRGGGGRGGVVAAGGLAVARGQVVGQGAQPAPDGAPRRTLHGGGRPRVKHRHLE